MFVFSKSQCGVTEATSGLLLQLDIYCLLPKKKQQQQTKKQKENSPQLSPLHLSKTPEALHKRVVRIR